MPRRRRVANHRERVGYPADGERRGKMRKGLLLRVGDGGGIDPAARLVSIDVELFEECGAILDDGDTRREGEPRNDEGEQSAEERDPSRRHGGAFPLREIV